MPEFNCPIWGSPATKPERSDFDGVRVDSPRAGGRYEATANVMLTLPSLTNEEQAKLTTWIVDQHRSGVDVPRVNDAVVREIRGKKPLRTSERIARLFLLLSEKRFKPADLIQFDGGSNGNAPTELAEFGSWLESVDDRDTVMLVRLLLDEGLVRQVGIAQTYSLTAKGFERLEQMEVTGAGFNQVFVAMWFDKSMYSVFAEGIGPAIRDAGYRPFRIDKKEHANKIDDEIVAEIKRSRFVIADFTCPVFGVDGAEYANGRGGVYYEAGFAQGLGIPVIWSCRADCLKHVHFDTRQYSHVVWNTAADLREAMYNRIAAHVGVTPNAPGKGTSTAGG